MSQVERDWESLRRAVNGLPPMPTVGEYGIRDTENPCEGYDAPLVLAPQQDSREPQLALTRHTPTKEPLMRNSIYSIKFLLLALVALALAACSAPAPITNETTTEDVGEASEALCANYPVGGNGDYAGPPDGYVTKVVRNPFYASMLDVTFKNWTLAETTGTLWFGNGNIAFSGSGWTGSLSNPITEMSVCWPQGMNQATCGYSCQQGANNECWFINGTLAFVNDWTNGTILNSISGPASFGNGVTGIKGVAPAEPGHFRIYYDGGNQSVPNRRWTFANSTTCP